MNRDEAIRRAEIAMAWAKGEAVQFQLPGYTEGWNDQVSAKNNAMPRFFDPDYKWRIKPNPLECWVWKFDDADRFHNAAVLSRDEPLTDRIFASQFPGRWVRMREVADE